MDLYLSSSDSISINNENSALDFTVELPTPLHLEQNKWKVALTHFKVMGYRKKSFGVDLYVYSDILEHETFVLDAYRPLLDLVDSPGPILHPHYVTVAEEYIHRIRVYIKTKHHRTPIISGNGVRCTLRLKRK